MAVLNLTGLPQRVEISSDVLGLLIGKRHPRHAGMRRYGRRISDPANQDAGLIWHDAADELSLPEADERWAHNAMSTLNTWYHMANATTDGRDEPAATLRIGAHDTAHGRIYSRRSITAALADLRACCSDAA